MSCWSGPGVLLVRAWCAGGPGPGGPGPGGKGLVSCWSGPGVLVVRALVVRAVWSVIS